MSLTCHPLPSSSFLSPFPLPPSWSTPLVFFSTSSGARDDDTEQRWRVQDDEGERLAASTHCVSKILAKASGADHSRRRRRGELSAGEYEAREMMALGLGGEKEVQVDDAGGEDLVAMPPRRHKHRHRA